jgi:hypothetical protein
MPELQRNIGISDFVAPTAFRLCGSLIGSGQSERYRLLLCPASVKVHDRVSRDSAIIIRLVDGSWGETKVVGRACPFGRAPFVRGSEPKLPGDAVRK